MIRYVLETMVFQLLFLLVYDLFLRRETFFQWNRAYLLGAYSISLLLPLVKIPAMRAFVPAGRIWPAAAIHSLDGVTVSAAATSGTGWSVPWIPAVFLGGLAMAVLLFAWKLVRLYTIKKKGLAQKYPLFTKILVTNSHIAFSFFRDIFVGDRHDAGMQKHIIAHEMVHLRQRHSLDLLYFEFFRIVNWFNPLVYGYQRRIAEIHEFIADEAVPWSGRKLQYERLLSSVFETHRMSFINHFFKSSLIKKRIVMLQKSRSLSIRKLKYLALLPVLGLMMCYTACQDEGLANPDETAQVKDVWNLSPQEEEQVFSRVKALAATTSPWTYTVTDGTTSLHFMKGDGKSFITGPNEEHIDAKMVIEGAIPDESEAGFLDFAAAVPFRLVQQAPVFPGCEEAEDPRACFNEHLQEHIRKNFNYPEEAFKKGIQGRVNIMFTIDREGKVTDIKKRGPDPLLEEEAVRIIEKLPQMQPGRQEGQTVDVPYSIPISFKLK